MEAARASKKPFDKKAWRKKTYDKKTILEDFQKKRKSYMQHKYNKIKKNEAPGLDVSKIYGQSEKSDKSDKFTAKDNRTPRPEFKKKSLVARAQQQAAEQKLERERQQAEFLRRQTEKQAKLKVYKEKKEKRYKTLKAKTKRGQPLMGGRIELLLEQIQASM